MQPPRAVIVGTGHSGTKYIAEVLRASGAYAGHEAWFNPYAMQVDGLDVESSWLATQALDHYEGIVWHQVREPLKTITSIAYTGGWYGDYFLYRKQLMREVTDDAVLNAMITYVDFNLEAEKHASRRWRVEDVNVKLIIELRRELGLKSDRPKIRKALEKTSKTANAHWRSTPLSWEKLPNHPVKDELIEMTERYGYEGP